MKAAETIFVIMGILLIQACMTPKETTTENTASTIKITETPEKPATPEIPETPVETMDAEEEKLPGNVALPSTTEELAKIAALETGDYPYDVEDYFAKPKTSEFKFSPNGKYFSYREKDENGKRHVYIKNTETGVSKKILEEGDELIRGYGWPNNEQLIFVKDQGGNENYQLYAVDLDGSNEKNLTPFDDVRVNILEILKDQPEDIIISMNKDNPQFFEPYKLNIVSGEMKKLYEAGDPQNPVIGYDFDKDGNLRAITKQVNGIDYYLMYRTSEDSPFELVMKFDWKGGPNLIDFDYTSDNPHDCYLSNNLNSDKDRIERYDLAKKEVIEVLFEDGNYDVGGMSTSRKRGYEIDYFHYTGVKREIVPVSDFYKKMHSKFEEEFEGKQFYITDDTDEEDKFLIYVNSDRYYGAYYVYDVEKDEFKKLLDLMPQLKEEDMAEMVPVKYKARDGLIIEGYITLPEAAQKGEKVPLIVNPHGGPYGPRDNWGFNPESQLFASRGYATLQVNYRGSGGYGKKHYLAGQKQIGRKMLDDLEDGVDHVISKGWIDKDRVAIYGASYGGLATLGSLVKTPEKYSCGVDYVGVSNLFTFINSIPPYWKPYLKQISEQWYDKDNPVEKKIMEEVSPALNVDKMTKPLFVVQGANDPRVNIDESDQVVTNLRSKGVDVPYMVKYNEGHGFGHEENRIELYETMMGFLRSI